MAKWTVALSNYDAPGKRVKKGDIIDMKSPGHKWSPSEQINYKIVTLDDITLNQTAALTEAIFDLNSYVPYEPLSLEGFVIVGRLENESSLKRVELYADYVEAMKYRIAYPADYLMKRRFKILSSGNLTKIDVYDNLKNRNVVINDDLNTIKPLEL